ncbi:MAG: peptide chain release factor N(5)-glutamine methyltransferase, partial [Chloroflexota bacterium]
PRLDAELLLGHVLGVRRATVLAEPESGVSETQAAEFGALIERRARGVPVAYLRGLKEFYGLVLSVDERALIPRPETETVVDRALAVIAHRLTEEPRPADSQPLLVWDVGTGSGAIPVTLAVECRRRGYARDVTFLATDISAEAIALATENAVAHAVADVIRFAVADLTDVPGAGSADLLTANLPYITSDELPQLPVAASYEPPVAFDGGPDGLTFVRRLFEDLPRALALGGTAMLEIGTDQADAVVALAPSGWQVVVYDDLAAWPRVVELTRPEAT